MSYPQYVLEAIVDPVNFGGSLAYDGCVSITSDKLAWGGYGFNSYTGTASVFALDAATGLWSLEQDLAADGSSEMFGISVALSGNRLAVGAPGMNSWEGAVYLFLQATPSSTWTKQQVLQLPTPAGNDIFGWNVAMRGDTLAVGAYGMNNFAGAAHTYKIDASGMAIAGSHQALAASDPVGSASGAYFGWSVALSASEQRLMVGAVRSNGVRGSAYLFSRAPSAPGITTVTGFDAWNETSLVNDGTAGAPGDRFGTSVAVEEDSSGGGGAMVVSGSKHKSISTAYHNGGAFVYSQSTLTATLTEDQLLAPPAGDGALNGGSLAFASDRIIVGPYGAGCNPMPGETCTSVPDNGKVYVHTGCDGSSSSSSGGAGSSCTLAQTLVPNASDPVVDGFGSALSITPDGMRLAIVSPKAATASDPDYDGVVYIYKWTTGPPPPSQPSPPPPPPPAPLPPPHPWYPPPPGQGGLGDTGDGLGSGDPSTGMLVGVALGAAGAVLLFACGVILTIRAYAKKLNAAALAVAKQTPEVVHA